MNIKKTASPVIENEVEAVDLFEVYETLPLNMQAIIEKFGALLEEGEDVIAEFLAAVQVEGYTFDWGLSNEPMDLHKIPAAKKATTFNIEYTINGNIRNSIGINADNFNEACCSLIKYWAEKNQQISELKFKGEFDGQNRLKDNQEYVAATLQTRKEIRAHYRKRLRALDTRLSEVQLAVCMDKVTHNKELETVTLTKAAYNRLVASAWLPDNRDFIDKKII